MKRTIIKNAEIHTMDANNSVAEAAVIEDGTITYVGNNKEAESMGGKAAEIVDAQGNVVLPGFVESHVHVPGNAYNILFNINLAEAKSMDETLNTVKNFIAENPHREIYYGKGFTSTVFPGMENSYGPRKERLDEICPDKPVVLIDYGGHVHWLNSTALKRFGITENTPDVRGGIIEKDPETGELWGILKEEAKSLYPDPVYSFDDNVRAVGWLQDSLNAYGYTSIFALRPPSCKDPSPLYDAMDDMRSKDQLKLRVTGGREIKVNMDEGNQIDDAVRQKEKYTGQIKGGTAKYFIDGVVEGASAFLCEPYAQGAQKGESYFGESLWEIERLKKAFEKTLSKGLNIHIHAIGDRAVKEALDALEYAQDKVPGDHRNSITHLQLVRDEDIKRMADLNVIACCNVHWHFKDPIVFFDAELPFLSEERAGRQYPLKSFIDAGVRVTSSGDIPITAHPDPFFAIQIGVTRNLADAAFHHVEPISHMDDPKYLLNKDERVSVMDMVRAYTVNGAYANHAENETGSIEVGKYGDLIIIDRDIFTIDPATIERTKVLKTIFGGEVVYENENCSESH